jgi:hypothetical protein
MQPRLCSILAAGLVVVGVLIAGGPACVCADSSIRTAKLTEDKPPPEDTGIEVEARGPVHEGFAQPVPRDTVPTPVIPKDPPKPIPEVPPDQKPEGKDVQWLPGYWSWDTDKKDFLWVSGTWRVPPADRTWMPGHWTKTSDGWQWVPGFWSDANDKQPDYVQPPPRSLDYGPSAPAPDENSFYVPGTWLPIRDRFVWRPGYWSAYRAGFVWNSSRYAWSPGGYIFLNGYWDFPFEDRGLLFAPAYFNYPYWSNPLWRYRPGFAVGFNGLLGSLWLGPGYGSYYFGNYYGRGYAGRGFSPWLAYGPRFHDPAFGYYSWANRGNPAWLRGLQNTYRGRASGTLPLPANTLAAQNSLLARSNLSPSARSGLQGVAPLGKANPSMKLATVSSAEMARHTTNINSLGTRSQSRVQREAASRTAQGASGHAVMPSSFQRGTAPTRSFYSGPNGGGPKIIQGTAGAGGPKIINGATRSTPNIIRSAPSYRSVPAYRSAPSRSAPSYRSAPAYRGGSSRGGGGRGSSGGHRR